MIYDMVKNNKTWKEALAEGNDNKKKKKGWFW
jgi:hypothetical protein